MINFTIFYPGQSTNENTAQSSWQWGPKVPCGMTTDPQNLVVWLIPQKSVNTYIVICIALLNGNTCIIYGNTMHIKGNSYSLFQQQQKNSKYFTVKVCVVSIKYLAFFFFNDYGKIIL